MFDSLSAKFSGAFSSLRGKGRIKAGDLDEITTEIRSALLDSDVAVSVVDNFIAQIKQRSLPLLDELNKSHPKQFLI
jgi:signal recognition particle subunit SRP54